MASLYYDGDSRFLTDAEKIDLAVKEGVDTTRAVDYSSPEVANIFKGTGDTTTGQLAKEYTQRLVDSGDYGTNVFKGRGYYGRPLEHRVNEAGESLAVPILSNRLATQSGREAEEFKQPEAIRQGEFYNRGFYSPKNELQKRISESYKKSLSNFDRTKMKGSSVFDDYSLDDRGNFVKGVARGTDNVQATMYGLGAMAADNLGWEEASKFMMDGYNDNIAEAAKSKGVSFEQVTQDPIKNLGAWAAGALGEAVPSLLSMAAGGGVLGAVGKKVAEKRVKDMVAKRAMDYASKKAQKDFGIPKGIADGLVKKIAKNPKKLTSTLREQTEASFNKYGRRAAYGPGKKAGKAGAAAGGFGVSAGQQSGGSYGELLEAGVSPEDADHIAALVGVAGGALDLFGVVTALKRFFPAKTLSVKDKLDFVKKMGVATGTQSFIEGSTEGMQEAIALAGRWYADPKFDPLNNEKHKAEAKSRIMEGAAAGALVGGFTGGFGQLAGSQTTDADDKQPPPLDDSGTSTVPPDSNDLRGGKDVSVDIKDIDKNVMRQELQDIVDSGEELTPERIESLRRLDVSEVEIAHLARVLETRASEDAEAAEYLSKPYPPEQQLTEQDLPEHRGSTISAQEQTPLDIDNTGLPVQLDEEPTAITQEEQSIQEEVIEQSLPEHKGSTIQEEQVSPPLDTSMAVADITDTKEIASEMKAAKENGNAERVKELATRNDEIIDAKKESIAKPTVEPKVEPKVEPELDRQLGEVKKKVDAGAKKSEIIAFLREEGNEESREFLTEQFGKTNKLNDVVTDAINSGFSTKETGNKLAQGSIKVNPDLNFEYGGNNKEVSSVTNEANTARFVTKPGHVKPELWDKVPESKKDDWEGAENALKYLQEAHPDSNFEIVPFKEGNDSKQAIVRVDPEKGEESFELDKEYAENVFDKDQGNVELDLIDEVVLAALQGRSIPNTAIRLTGGGQQVSSKKLADKIGAKSEDRQDSISSHTMQSRPRTVLNRITAGLVSLEEAGMLPKGYRGVKIAVSTPNDDGTTSIDYEPMFVTKTFSNNVGKKTEMEVLNPMFGLYSEKGGNLIKLKDYQKSLKNGEFRKLELKLGTIETSQRLLGAMRRANIRNSLKKEDRSKVVELYTEVFGKAPKKNESYRNIFSELEFELDKRQGEAIKEMKTEHGVLVWDGDPTDIEDSYDSNKNSFDEIDKMAVNENTAYGVTETEKEFKFDPQNKKVSTLNNEIDALEKEINGLESGLIYQYEEAVARVEDAKKSARRKRIPSTQAIARAQYKEAVEFKNNLEAIYKKAPYNAKKALAKIRDAKQQRDDLITKQLVLDSDIDKQIAINKEQAELESSNAKKSEVMDKQIALNKRSLEAKAVSNKQVTERENKLAREQAENEQVSYFGDLKKEAGLADTVLKELGILTKIKMVLKKDAGAFIAELKKDNYPKMFIDQVEESFAVMKSGRVSYMDHIEKKDGTRYPPVIFLNPTKKELNNSVVMMHEIGHIVMRSEFDTLPEAAKARLRDAFANKNDKDFRESFANSLVEWSTSDKAPKNIYEAVMQKIANVLKGFWDLVNKYVPHQKAGRNAQREFNKFIESLYKSDESNPYYDKYRTSSFYLPVRNKLADADGFAAAEAAQKGFAKFWNMDQVRSVRNLLVRAGAPIDHAFRTARTVDNKPISVDIAGIGKIPDLGKWLARTFSTAPGEDNVGSLYEETRLTKSMYENRLTNFENKVSKKFSNLGKRERELKTRQALTKIAKDLNAGNLNDPLVKEAKVLLDDIYTELQGSTGGKKYSKIKQVKNYFPRVWDKEELSKRKDEAEAILGPELYLELAEGNPFNWADDSQLYGRGNRYSRSRELDPATVKKLEDAGFRNWDMAYNMDRYIDSAAQTIAWNNRFGHFITSGKSKWWTANHMLEVAMRKAQPQMREEEFLYLNKALGAARGELGMQMSRNMKNMSGILMTYQNFRVLATATLSSIPDIAGIFVRTAATPGGLGMSYRGLQRGLKTVYNRVKGNPDELLSLARMTGNWESRVVDNALVDSQNINFNSKMQRWNHKFFRATGLDQWTKMTRVMALATAQEFISFHSSQNNAKSKKYLSELGITAQDVHGVDIGSLANMEKLEGKNRKVALAMNRFVDQSILRTDRSQRPAWGSDPRYALFFQLKSFMFSFHQTINRRLWMQTKEAEGLGKVAPIALAASMYLPLAMLGMEIREILKYQMFGMEPVGIADKKGWDYTIEALQRTGLTGIGQVALDANNTEERGESAVLGIAGPSVSWASEMISGDWTKANYWLKQVPGLSQATGLRHALIY